jgi:hypothetical protein
MTEIGRLLTAMATPMDRDGAVDFAQAARLARALLDSGSEGLVVAGTTGESVTGSGGPRSCFAAIGGRPDESASSAVSGTCARRPAGRGMG